MKTATPLIVVLTALDVEDHAFRTHLSDLRVERHTKGTYFEKATVPGTATEVVLATTGEGALKAGVIAERAIAEFSPAAMIFAGIAGALADDLALGDVVVATRTYWYHSGREEDEFLARPRTWETAYELEQLAHHVARGDRWTRFLGHGPLDQPPAVHFRPVAVGDVVLNSRRSPLYERIKRFCNDAAAIEMESAGAAQAAHLNLGVPMITLRGISDHASGEKDASDQLGWRAIAAGNAAAFALALMSELELDAEPPAKDEEDAPGVSNSGNVNFWKNQIHVDGVFVAGDLHGGGS